MLEKIRRCTALCLGLALWGILALEADSKQVDGQSQLHYQVVLVNEPDSTVRNEGGGPVAPSGIFHSSGYVFGEHCEGVGGGGTVWQDVLLLPFRVTKPLPEDVRNLVPRVAYNATFHVRRETASGVLKLSAVVSLYRFRQKSQPGLQYEVAVFDTTCTVAPGHPVRLLTLQDGCPNRVAVYVRLIESTEALRTDFSPDLQELLRGIQPARIPVNFYLRYEQRDSVSGRVVRLLSTKQIGFEPAKPFVFRFANPVPPELQAHPESWPEYRIAGYLVPLKRRADSLHCVLLLQQGLGYGGRMKVSMFTHKRFTLPKGDLVRIVLQSPKMSLQIPLPDQPGQYVRIQARDGFLKGIREELYVRAYF